MVNKNYDLSINLNGISEGTDSTLKFENSMMLVSYFTDSSESCRLPFVALSEEASEKQSLVLGSFALQKYAF